MSRIPEVTIDRAGWLATLIYRFARRRYGAVPQPVAVAAHHPGLLLSSGIVEMTTEKVATVLPASVRELATYRVASRIGCSWCVDFGTMLQLKEGLNIERLKHIEDYAFSEHFDELDRLVIAYADAMTEQPVTVTDEQVAELDRRLGHKAVLELTYMIALENERTRFNHALGITDQGFTSGEACRVPMP
ncbi:AhpD family alkylhydroperoxidase [Halopolyspora algeriensis]|uniref:AhpD family alkylhydroperoxidase n=1 Tax=Halopolyspora algeriensis TaxID=1500506 RepID=A0A368VKG1_9ACTN|nr:carboxymuconolactone decarboxylase family protein [Halopolyspora algeriensis]RCW40777.1 AhpD family alkylhydroperoxidase [Halopolyspora algeriensis]TQM53304.1 AhpD family alkylhydroperoxidase [Halopolyspora algeriensis]